MARERDGSGGAQRGERYEITWSVDGHLRQMSSKRLTTTLLGRLNQPHCMANSLTSSENGQHTLASTLARKRG